MKQTLLLTISSLSIAVFTTACTNQMASVGLSAADKTEECMIINKKMIKIDNFITVVNDTSAFHLEEAARAIEAPGITVSTNKKQMLRDANKKKTELESEHQKLGCETPKK